MTSCSRTLPTGAPGLAEWAEGFQVKRLVYIACDVASLARDAKALVERGYIPADLQLVDMFPQTHHVEALMSLCARRRRRGGQVNGRRAR